jgi:transposase-like protein
LKVLTKPLEGGRASSRHGYRPSEAETFWTAFLRKLARRGLRGVKLVISDAHESALDDLVGFFERHAAPGTKPTAAGSI